MLHKNVWKKARLSPFDLLSLQHSLFVPFFSLSIKVSSSWRSIEPSPWAKVLSHFSDQAAKHQHAAKFGPDLRSARVHKSTAVKDAFLPFISSQFKAKWREWVILMQARHGQRVGQLLEVFPWMHVCSWPPSQAISLHSRDKCRQQRTVDCCQEGRERGLWGLGQRLYLGCCDVVPCRITFKFNSSPQWLLRHVNVPGWHIWTRPTAHTHNHSL